MRIIIPTAIVSIIITATLVRIALRDDSLVPVFVLVSMALGAAIIAVVLERQERRLRRDAERYERVARTLEALGSE